jgi:hypothetical protein
MQKLTIISLPIKRYGKSDLTRLSFFTKTPESVMRIIHRRNSSSILTATFRNTDKRILLLLIRKGKILKTPKELKYFTDKFE